MIATAKMVTENIQSLFKAIALVASICMVTVIRASFRRRTKASGRKHFQSNRNNDHYSNTSSAQARKNVTMK